MLRVTGLALALMLSLTVAPGAAAQQMHFMREKVLRAATPQDQALVDRVRADLAQLRTAQEAYFAGHQGYAPELADLKGLKLGSGASVVVLMAGPKGWKAEATHPALAGSEVVHVMRLREGESCPMMQGGGQEKAKEAAPGAAGAAEHQH